MPLRRSRATCRAGHPWPSRGGGNMANPGVEVSQIQTPSLSRPLGGQAASSARRIRHWAADGTDDRQRCGFSADRACPSGQRVAIVAILVPRASGDAATRSRSRAPSALKSLCSSRALPELHDATDIRASWARRSLDGYSRPGCAPSTRRSGGSSARGACAAGAEDDASPDIQRTELLQVCG